MPYFEGSGERCSALRTITGKAVEYLSALARWTPPQPVAGLIEPVCLFAFWTREYSVRHCRSRMSDGMLMTNGTQKAPPQLRFGGPVELWVDEKNMQSETKRSPNTFA
jgi:hypothetical protein